LPVEEQLAIIRRGVEKIVPEVELAGMLKKSRETGTPLRIKYGIDPTGIDLHLGHTVPMRKLRQFQELGHQAVIIIGNYTALVGDPSGRDQARSRLTAEKVEANAQTYLEQVGKVIDLSNAEVHRNGDWFGKMSFSDILELTSKVTVAQMLTRDDFSKRFATETPIYLHECLYPIMQAWDSVKIKSDIELGGTEQLYSFMLARDLQRDQGLSQQIGVMSPILVGLDGVRRMGKSLGNYIGIAESPYDMMKKFMQVPDACLRMYFELLTNMPLAEVDQLLAGHPKEAKIALAKLIIGEYHSAEMGVEAANRWQREISEGALPTDIPEVVLSAASLTDGQIPAAILLKQLGLCPSTSDARRQIDQGSAALTEARTKIEKHDQQIAITDGLMVWVGKKKFCRVKVQ
ncbi:MAG: tyrosine--tRNA ligase, partial [Planctomycetota bacterium]